MNSRLNPALTADGVQDELEARLQASSLKTLTCVPRAMQRNSRNDDNNTIVAVISNAITL
jgi:hypothetical protein